VGGRGYYAGTHGYSRVLRWYAGGWEGERGARLFMSSMYCGYGSHGLGGRGRSFPRTNLDAHASHGSTREYPWMRTPLLSLKKIRRIRAKWDKG
jgi:hypothetical protein